MRYKVNLQEFIVFNHETNILVGFTGCFVEFVGDADSHTVQRVYSSVDLTVYGKITQSIKFISA